MRKATYIVQSLDEMARSNYKIAVSANSAGLGRLLGEKRYKVLYVPQGMPETPPDTPNVHDFLVKENVKVFITKDKDHFNDVYHRHYALIELSLRGLDEQAIADILEKVMMYEPDLKPVVEDQKGNRKKRTRYRKVVVDGHYMKTRYNEIVP